MFAGLLDTPSLVRSFATRSAAVFIVVAIALHFTVEQLVEEQFRSHADFHATYVVDAVLTPRLQHAATDIIASPDTRASLTKELKDYLIDLDEAVYHVVLWSPDGTSLVGDELSHANLQPPGYRDHVQRALGSGPFSVLGAAPYLPSPPVESTLRSFVPLPNGRQLVAEIHQDWTPTLAASRAFSRTLDVGLVGGLALLWALLLPIAKRAGRRLRERARTDDLTALPNRTALEERLRAAIARLDEDGQCIAVLFIDLDGFKSINDTYGHATGDTVLKQVAQRLLTSTQSKDTVARFAGDEFVVILEDTDLVLAEQTARRLLDEIKRPLDEADSISLSASIGMSLTAISERDADQLLRQADAAMYQVKSEGGAAHCVFNDDLRDRVARHNDIDRELRTAVANDELHLVYQPFVSLAGSGNEVVAIEALLRWTHPRLGQVSPGEFIPLAERNGTIRSLGLWVIQEACRELAQIESFLDPSRAFTVFVNLSSVQLTADLLSIVDACLDDSGAHARHLGFEITETAVSDRGDDEVRELLCALRERGCRIALDDFGTGYSSLSRLRAMPLDLLKLDGSFVHDLHEDRREHAIMTAVAGLARELDIEVLAEGVETREQLQAATSLSFDLAQGYYLARPDAPHLVPHWLEFGVDANMARTVSQ